MYPQNNLYSTTFKNIDDFGIIGLMYHRFEENKYPTTNIKLEDFKKQLEMIESQNINFINPKNFEDELISNKKKRKILLTIDDAFLSFYENAWPILNKKKNSIYSICKYKRSRFIQLYDMGTGKGTSKK